MTPETVTKRVNLLRVALGDNAQEPCYIAGVRGRGYRLIAAESPAAPPAPPAEVPSSAPVVVTQPNELSAGHAVATEPRTVTAKPRRIRWLVMSVLLAVIIAVAISTHTINKARSVGAQPQLENPQRAAGPINARARTVAVLPFDNISADAADAYLAQGLPEMILNLSLIHI